MIGVNVVEKGTENGAITDFEGNFSLSLSSPNAVLVFSYIGYVSQEVSAKNQNGAKIVLKEDTETLDEVVVIGYGAVRKADVAGAVAVLDNKSFKDQPITQVSDALQGRVSGVQVENSGVPGGSVKIRVRGSGSINKSNDPLYVVDGIVRESGLDGINPEDIQSMQVLKDASSTAIYGSRGSNGVVLVTTKTGLAGATQVTLDASFGVANVYKRYDLLNSREYAQALVDAGKKTQDEMSVYLNGTNPGIDWQDEIFRTGITQNYEISMSGGTENTSYSMSFGYQNDHGLLKNDILRRYNGRISLDHQINSILNVGVNISYTFKNQDKRQNPLNLANKIPCIGRAYDDEGNFILNPAPGNSSSFSPLCDEQPGAYEDNIRSKRMFASGYLNANILKGLTFKSTIGLDINDSREGIYKDRNTIGEGYLGQKSTSSIQSDNDYRYTWENILNYTTILEKHGLTAMIGSSTTVSNSETVLASGANQASALTSFHDLGANADSKEISSGLIETKMVSFFGRLNYKFNEKYIFQASLRADGSSVLAEGHKWGYFPSVSGAWRISEENFMKNQNFISNLKLRLSWGIAGNSAIDAYATLGGLSQSVYAFGNTVMYGYYPSAIPNEELTWEKTATWNLGIDFAFWENRISGSVDLYKSNTTDLLLPSLLPSSTGYSSIMQNVGKTENKGFEITMNTIWFQGENFSWNTDWTYSLNREKIKELNKGVTRDEGNLWFVGSPTQVFYDYKKIGIWQLGEEDAAKSFGGFKPGDIKVADMSPKGSEGEGVFSTDDRIIFSRVPKYTFGVTNNITFKDFDLMFFIYGRVGQYVKDSYTQLYKPSALENSAPVNYWTPENPSNEYPRPNSSYSTNNYLLQSSLAYRKASFVKIRDITLGYTLPKKWISRAKIQRLRIYCTLNNFITFTKFPNYDPESDGSMDFPLTKQVLFGINLGI